MGAPAGSPFALEHTYLDDLKGLYEPWQAATAPDPRLVVLNDEVAAELGLDVEALRSPEGVAVLVGNVVPDGATPVALAYAGHQFGSYSPRLGDGRALLVGELVDGEGRRRDLHLKGSGRTPFARGGDGKAAIGPMLREHVIGEAMHALGIPTTRALAVLTTGEHIQRDLGMLPGAVLVRVAASHLRVGTFQYAAAGGDLEVLRRLADHAIARHHPAAADADEPYLALLESVIEVQAALVARWLSVGFVHGVMNTDNVTISGQTIDYGPCAFLDAYDPATVFSSIDHGGRYAFGNQPQITLWNLTRFAEALLPLLGDEEPAVEAATAALNAYADRFREHLGAGMRAKLGLVEAGDDDGPLVDDLLALLHANGVDFTNGFRALSSVVRGDPEPARDQYADRAAFDAWTERWLARLDLADDASRERIAAEMDRANPLYLPRNHLVEEALDAATGGDLGPLEQLVEVVRDPFVERPGLDRYAQPAPGGTGPYRTFCGT